MLVVQIPDGTWNLENERKNRKIETLILERRKGQMQYVWVWY